MKCLTRAWTLTSRFSSGLPSLLLADRLLAVIHRLYGEASTIGVSHPYLSTTRLLGSIIVLISFSNMDGRRALASSPQFYPMPSYQKFLTFKLTSSVLIDQHFSLTSNAHLTICLPRTWICSHLQSSDGSQNVEVQSSTNSTPNSRGSLPILNNTRPSSETPYLSLITLHQLSSPSTNNCQPNLAKRALFMSSDLRNPAPPCFLGRQRIFQFSKCTCFFVDVDPQMH